MSSENTTTNSSSSDIKREHPMQEEVTRQWKAAIVNGAEQADAAATKKGRRLRKKDRLFFYQVLFAMADLHESGTDFDDHDFDSFEAIKLAWELWSGKPLRTEDEVRASSSSKSVAA